MPTREWLTREDVASPTAATESVFLTAAIDALEERDVMTSDIPNALYKLKDQTQLKNKKRLS